MNIIGVVSVIKIDEFFTKLKEWGQAEMPVHEFLEKC